MKNLIKIFLILIIILNSLFIIHNSVFAIDTDLGTLIGIGPWQIVPADAGVALSKIASVILGALTALGGLMVFLELVLGALSWISAAGDKANLEKARNQITNAVIGLVIIVASWAIVYLIGAILGIDILNPQKILPRLSPDYVAPPKTGTSTTSGGGSNSAPDFMYDSTKCKQMGYKWDSSKGVCNAPY